MKRKLAIAAALLAGLALLAFAGNALLFRWLYRPFDSKAPQGWVLADEKYFSFSHPPDLVRCDIGPGSDSYIGEYRSGSLLVDFDYGWYSNDLSDNPRERVRVDGRRAWLAALPASLHVPGYGDGIGIHFPDLGGRAMLTLSAYGRTAADLETCRTLIGTIRIR